MSTYRLETLRNRLQLVKDWGHWHLRRAFSGSSANRQFSFQGNNYSYFDHHYNRPWRNERTVEVPVIREALKQAANKRILEVGNVLSYYFGKTYDIVDKYDLSPGIINQDIVDFNPAQPYDLIVSISTLEHVGRDEVPRHPEKVVVALDHLKDLVAPGGLLFFTVPVGYNTYLDNYLKMGKHGFKLGCLKRISQRNDWVECSLEEALKCAYGSPFEAANAVVIGSYRP